MIGECVLGYLFVGGVVFMLLVDELRAKANRRSSRMPAVVMISLATIVAWPYVLCRRVMRVRF